MALPDRDLFEVADSLVDREQAKNLSLLRFEEMVTTRLLRFHELSSLAPILRQRCRELTGHGHLLFRHFLANHPSYPVYMIFDKVPYLHELTVEDWVRRLTKTLVYKKYQEAKLLVPEMWQEKSFAMVIPTYNFDGTMIIHTTPGGTRPGCRRMTANVDYEILTFESLEDFCETQKWTS